MASTVTPENLVPGKSHAKWNRGRRLPRPAITEGFVMPGFAGRYYMWPEEYWLLSKYVDLTRGDYLEIGSMCGIIAGGFAKKYPQRRFVCVDFFEAGHATIAGDKDIFLRNVREHNLTNVTLLEGDSAKVVPTLKQGFDIAFIDAGAVPAVRRHGTDARQPDPRIPDGREGPHEPAGVLEILYP